MKRIAFVNVALLLAVTAGCGYVNKSLLPGDIKSVRVDVFENQTLRPDLELTVSKAVIDELLSSTRLKVTDDNPDSVLKGTLTATPREAFIENRYGVVTTGYVSLEVALKWTDTRTDRAIPLRRKVVKARAYYNVGRGENFSAAVQKAAELLAKKVVGAMEEEW
ncbi:MAG: hypothetical protein DRP79_05455 [Planctomycetota bacterium]|nr:MAG: hypothetical protein DRP79_05455 [Planctomycetota bacterium]